MEYIPISEDNYQILIGNQGSYETLEDFIMAMFQVWRAHTYEQHKDVIEDVQNEITEEKQRGINKSKKNTDGALWQFVASRLPEFPYKFFEYFELHSPADKHPPIDAIAFPGLQEDNIDRVELIDFQLSSPYVKKPTNKWKVRQCVIENKVSFRIINPKDINLNFIKQEERKEDH
jgi:predicted Holliday junction resolvase-like endonuclease